MNLPQDCFVLPIWSSYSSTITPDLKTDAKREGPREAEQVFLDELERLKRQEKDANKAAEALRKEFAQETENLIIQEGAAKASSTNIFSTVSTPAKASSTNLVNTVSTPVSTASPHDGLSLSDPTNPEQDDSEIPPLKDIYQNSTDALILGDPTLTVQTRSKVNKSSRACAFVSYVQKQRRNNHKDFQHFQDTISLDTCNFPFGKKAIGTKWVLIEIRKDERDKELLSEINQDNIQDDLMGELTFFLGLQVKQKADGIFISQDKYVAKILKKFDFVNVKTASTLIETHKPLVKDEEANDVDVHLYRSIIGSLMYWTASRPDIMFAVCACSRFQVTPKTSHLSVVKRIFRYLKGKSKLGLWYPRVSSIDLEAYSDSDYAGANLDRKSTTGGCQFLGMRLISWQCKKQTIVATFTTEAVYVAAASCCGQVLWIQNHMLDYGFNFMITKIYIDNESTICIVKNPIYHSKTKHIAIRHHFIRDAYEKKLIQVLKIHTDDNVADLLTKAFDVSSSLGFRESLGRALDGTEALMLPKLFILWLATVSTDSAELVPMGKVSTAIETLKKNTAKVSYAQYGAYLEKTEASNAEFHEVIDFITRSSIICSQSSGGENLRGLHQCKSLSGMRVNGNSKVFMDLYSLDYMETEDAQDEGRTRDVVDEEKENAEDVLSTAQQKVSTDRPIVSTDGSKVSTDRQKYSIDDQNKEEWEDEEERNRLAEEEATNNALIRNYNDIKARIKADRLLAEKLQEEEREQFIIEERAKFLHDTIAAQRKFLAQQRSEAIRNRPPTKK
ncbi:hypothetical protein Tco_1302688 [Tanacetum coccineum]